MRETVCHLLTVSEGVIVSSFSCSASMSLTVSEQGFDQIDNADPFRPLCNRSADSITTRSSAYPRQGSGRQIGRQMQSQHGLCPSTRQLHATGPTGPLLALLCHPTTHCQHFCETSQRYAPLSQCQSWKCCQVK